MPDIDLRVLVCGDRNWQDHTIIIQTLSGLLQEQIVSYGKLVIIEGCARGADSFACHFLDGCKIHGSHDDVIHEHYPAEWELYGGAAGPRRNRRMLFEGKPDVVYAFHDDIVHSKGTRHMANIARNAHIPVYVISHYKPHHGISN